MPKTQRPANIIKIGEASRILGVHPNTLRLWEKLGKVKPATRTMGGGTRYYDINELEKLIEPTNTHSTVQDLAAELGIDPSVLERCTWALGVALYSRATVMANKANIMEYVDSLTNGTE